MAADERNFRSIYYEKVGFRSVEEKKSLEIILNNRPLDFVKLKQFCLRFCLQDRYRNFLWKVLLDVVPIYVDSHTFILAQRKQEYADLLHSLNVMKIIDSTTPKPQAFYAMWLLQMGNFSCDIKFINDNPFVLIVQSVSQIFDDDVDIYWISKNLFNKLNKFKQDFPKLTEISLNLLEKEDSSLYKHLQKQGILDNLPMERWFNACFAGVLHENALAKIWDKFIGGSCKIMVYVVLILLANLKNKLLKAATINEALLAFKDISEEVSEVIANKSIDMWQQNGSALTVHDKPK